MRFISQLPQQRLFLLACVRSHFLGLARNRLGHDRQKLEHVVPVLFMNFYFCGSDNNDESPASLCLRAQPR